MPVAFFAQIAAWFGTTLASEAARFLALKIFLTTLLVLVVPVVLNNFLIDILQAVMDKANSVAGSTQSHIMQLTGLSAYLADCLQIPLLVSILLGAVSVRFTLKLIRLG